MRAQELFDTAPKGRTDPRSRAVSKFARPVNKPSVEPVKSGTTYIDIAPKEVIQRAFGNDVPGILF